MRTLRWTTPLALAALAAAPLGAQQMGTMHGAAHEGMMGQGTMQMCSMMGGPEMMGTQGMMAGREGMMNGGTMAAHQGMAAGGMGGMDPGMMGAGALFGGVDLALTSDQETRLDDLVAQARQERLTHMQAAMSVQADAAGTLAGPNPDMGAYKRTLQEAATHMVQAHIAVANASVEARALLTPEQLAKLPEGAQLMNTMMCGMMGSGSMMGGQAGGGAHEQYPR